MPLDTPQRTAALAFAQAEAGSEDAHLGNPLHSLKRNLRRFDYVMARFGVTAHGLGATAHGLRHEALIDRYISKAGEAPPVRGGGPVPPEVDATATLAAAPPAGHNRVRAAGAYLGSSAGPRDVAVPPRKSSERRLTVIREGGQPAKEISECPYPPPILACLIWISTMNDAAPTFNLRFRHFRDSTSLLWFGVGLGIGLLGWRWGTSLLAVWAFKLTAGLGWSLVVLLLAASIVALLALHAKGRVAHLAYGDFLNTLRWGLPGALRAVSVLSGVVVVATVCWQTTGSGNALQTALGGVQLAVFLLWCWGGLIVIADHLAKRRSQHAGDR